MIDSPLFQPHHPPHQPHPPADQRVGIGGPESTRDLVVAAPYAFVRAAVRGLHAIALRRVQDRLAGLVPAPMADMAGGNAAEPDLETGLLAQLRAATTMHVRALHGRGEPPERVLVQAKHMLDVVLRQEGWHDPVATDALRRRVVRWSIEAYYDR